MEPFDTQGARWKVPFIMLLLGKPVDEIYAFCLHFCKYAPILSVRDFGDLQAPIGPEHEEMLSLHYRSQPGKFMYAKASAMDDIFQQTKDPQNGSLYFVCAILVLKRRILSSFTFRCLSLKLAMAGTGGKMLAPAKGCIEEFILGSHVLADQDKVVKAMNKHIRKIEDAITDTRNFFILLLKSPEDDDNGDLRKKCLKGLDEANRELVLYARKCYQRIPITTLEMAVRRTIFAKGEIPLDKELRAMKSREEAAKEAAKKGKLPGKGLSKKKK